MSCASSQQASTEYQEAISGQARNSEHQTTIFFMVDGFSEEGFQIAHHYKKIPHIENFFGSSQKIFRGQSIFPTLTFPNSVSFLTRLPVDQHGVNGNQVIDQTGKILDLTAPENIGWLNEIIREHSIFSILSKEKKRSVSFDSFFREGANAYLHRDLVLGLAYSNQEYGTLDDHTIDSLKNLLTETLIKDWPDFIYVHLIGVDALGHSYGPRDKKVFDYLAYLDQKLKPIFQLIQSAEKQGHPVSSVLSSDHGMIEVKYFLDLQKIVEARDKSIVMTNLGRAADLYWTKPQSAEVVSKFIQDLKLTKGIDWVARRVGGSLFVENSVA